MDFLGALNLISTGAQLVGGILDATAARSQASALSNQAAFALQFGEEQAQLAEEIAGLEAALLQQQGATAQEIAGFNAEIAQRNAAWERRAGDIVLDQARRSGEARLSAISSALSSQGRLVSDTTSDALIAESLANLERDLVSIEQSTASRVSAQRDQAGLFELQGERAKAFSDQQSRGRRRAGEIEAFGLRRSAELDAAGARVNARSAGLAGSASLFRTFTDVASLFSGRR